MPPPPHLQLPHMDSNKKRCPCRLAAAQTTCISVCDSETAANSHLPLEPTHQTVMTSNKESLLCHTNEWALSLNELLQLVLTCSSGTDSLGEACACACACSVLLKSVIVKCLTFYSTKLSEVTELFRMKRFVLASGVITALTTWRSNHTF